MRYAFTLGGRSHHVTLEEHADGPRFLVDGDTFEPRVERLGRGHYRVAVDGEEFEFRVEDDLVHEDGQALDLQVERARPQLVRAAGAARRAEGRIKPPMPGKVVEVHVEPGQVVKEGDPLIVLEAMKMQNDLRSPLAGTVKAVHVQPGTNVEAATVMVEIEPGES